MEMMRKKIAIYGPMICEQARSFACSSGFMDFKWSTGWLHQFLNKHNKCRRMINGEKDEAPIDITASWKKSN
jgi:hypothetical protein